MIKYTITIQEGDASATGYITTKKPLTGDEPIVKQRLEALANLLEPEDDYNKTFRKILQGKVLTKEEQ